MSIAERGLLTNLIFLYFAIAIQSIDNKAMTVTLFKQSYNSFKLKEICGKVDFSLPDIGIILSK
jgi:hypothetical protein